MIKKTLFLSIIFLVLACKTSYKTADFSQNHLPYAPDFSSNKSWAVLPDHYPESLNILRSMDWNADIWSDDVRNAVLQIAVKYQASAWSKAGNLYVPYYRQAHYRIFFEPFKDQGIEAWNIAFTDVKNAFQYYLENFNEGKPIIIASHSQGSMHAKELIKIFFDDI